MCRRRQRCQGSLIDPDYFCSRILKGLTILICATDMLKTVLRIKVVILKFVTWCLVKIINTLKGEESTFGWLFLSFEPFSLLHSNKLIQVRRHKAIRQFLNRQI